MPKKQILTVRPTMQADGSLLIEVETDAYTSMVEWFKDQGPQTASQAVATGIKMGLYRDLRLIEFYRNLPRPERVDIDFMVKRTDGTVLDDEGLLDLSTHGVTITQAGVRH